MHQLHEHSACISWKKNLFFGLLLLDFRHASSVVSLLVLPPILLVLLSFGLLSESESDDTNYLTSCPPFPVG